jgi:hypothetical protein
MCRKSVKKVSIYREIGMKVKLTKEPDNEVDK